MYRLIGDNPTPAQMKARNALALLVSEEGIDSALSVYVDLEAEVREKTFRDKYGLSQISGTICLARLFGERCCPYEYGNTNHLHTPPGMRHSSLWARDGQPAAFVFEPFKHKLTPDVMEHLTKFCDTHQLVCTFHENESFYYPGETTLIMIQRKY